jgi:hypothetical protein
MTAPPPGIEPLVDIGSDGQRLRVVAAGPAGLRDAWIEVEAYPFSGTIKTVLTEDDISQYRSAMQDFAAVGRAILGGHRAPQIELEREGDTIEVTVTASGDDPWPTIRYLIFLGL